jgi:hypothetical protein
MGEILELPKRNSSNGSGTRVLARRAESFPSELCENICIDLRPVKLNTAPSEYTAPPEDCA